MRAVITILGLSGTAADDKRALYQSKIPDILDANMAEFFNMFELLSKSANFFKNNEYSLVSVATKDAYEKNLRMISKCGVDIKPCEPVLIDDKDFNDIFAKMTTIIDKYDEVIVDITHGFRSIPILVTINLMMQNFKNPEKIKYILFAKEIKNIQKMRHKEFMRLST